MYTPCMHIRIYFSARFARLWPTVGAEQLDDASGNSPTANSANKFASVYQMNRRKMIPPNLLTAELPESSLAQMGKAERALYRQWV